MRKQLGLRIRRRVWSRRRRDDGWGDRFWGFGWAWERGKMKIMIVSLGSVLSGVAQIEAGNWVSEV